MLSDRAGEYVGENDSLYNDRIVSSTNILVLVYMKKLM